MAKRERVQQARRQAQRRRWIQGGVAALVVLVAVGAALYFNRPPAAEGFYRTSTPTEVADIISSGQSALAYFHSPT